MSTANTPEVFILDDTDHQAVIKITGYYVSAQTANVKIVTANTLRGANTSLPCILSIGAMEYTSSINAGYVAVQFIGNTSNSNAFTVGRCNDGQWNRYVPNSGPALPTGDLNLQQVNCAANDSFTIILTLIKEFQGMYWAGSNYGAGAWANTQNGY